MAGRRFEKGPKEEEESGGMGRREETRSLAEFCYFILFALSLVRFSSFFPTSSFMPTTLPPSSVSHQESEERQNGEEIAKGGVFSTSAFMHFLICKPIKLCSSLLSERKRRRGSTLEPVIEPTARPSLLRHLQSARSVDKGGSRRFNNTISTGSLDNQVQGREKKGTNGRSKSLSRHSAQRDFLKAVALGGGNVITDQVSLPTREVAFARFKETYPRFADTTVIDEVREEEYGHLEETGRVRLDYCGFGLFSHLQQLQQWESASFVLTETSVNLCSHALIGAAEEGTVECDIRKRIMQYLNVQETEYSMVFTVSKGAAFKLLADAYPFETCRHLLSMYDYESESVGFMAQRAKEKGGKISTAYFRWPSLRMCSIELRKQIIARRRKKGPVKGLFVFPVQSRVSGSKYSYQWMSLAQQNKWHVLLDASALGPKDMDSLGLSLFRPDFIIASFYKVFGADASGFGCLFIKNSAIKSIQDPSGTAASGIVRIIPVPVQWSLSGSSEGYSEGGDKFDDLDGEVMCGGGIIDSQLQRDGYLAPSVSSFSGPMLGSNKHATPDEDKNRLPCIEGSDEENDEVSSDCEDHDIVSVGEVTRSPVFSEDGTDNLFCIEIGPSPIGTASRTSVSEDAFSGPIRSSLFAGNMNIPVQKQVAHGSHIFEEGAAAQSITPQIEGFTSGHQQDESTSSVVDEVNISSSEDSEGMDVTGHMTNKGRLAKVELLDPGSSPFMDPNTLQMSSFSNVQGKREHSPECLTLALTEEEMRPREQEVAPICVENREALALELIHKNGKDEEMLVSKVHQTHSPAPFNEQVREVFKEEESGERRLARIVEMEIEPDHLPEEIMLEINACDSLEIEGKGSVSTAFERPKCSLSDEQKGKERASVTPWNQKESAISRETERDFRLLGRRTGERFSFGRNLSIGLHDSEELGFSRERVSFSCDVERTRDPYFGHSEEATNFVFFQDGGEIPSDDENIVEERWLDSEPQVFCKNLDHADMMGLNKSNLRLRCLINWLISSLLQLRHPGTETDVSLVHIYGPQIKFNRGASVAFNVYDCHGNMLQPEVVQMLADKNNISLGTGFLRNIQFSDNHEDMPVLFDKKKNETRGRVVNGREDLGRMPSRIQVVTAALGLLSNFEDVYRTWTFVARFLDADFVPKEIGHHDSPNRDTVSLVS